MKNTLPIIIAALAAFFMCASTSQAQATKCIAADGKVTYSNVACPSDTTSERFVNTNGNTLDGSALREKAQSERASTVQSENRERERAALEVSHRQQTSDAAQRNARNAEKDSSAYSNCTRDIERQGASENVKAELFAACLTAGSNQRQTGTSEATLRECIRNVERTGALPDDKARQATVCHGADVKAQPLVISSGSRPGKYNDHRPPLIASCNGNQCSDDLGHRYFKQSGSTLVREDGKRCQLADSKWINCS